MERGADFGVPDGEGLMSAAPETGRAWPIVSLVVLVALGGINVFLALFIVPKFEQIFQDALPGQRLPGLLLPRSLRLAGKKVIAAPPQTLRRQSGPSVTPFCCRILRGARWCGARSR